MPAWKKVIVSGSNPVFNHITASGAISSSGIITGTSITTGTIPALSNAGLVVVPSQTNITRLGTLTDLTVDNITINTDTITTSGGHLVIYPADGRQVQLGSTETGADVQFYSSVDGVDMLWDESAGMLDVNAKLLVDSSDISLDSTSTLNIDNSNTSNGITIGTATSGVPVQIGHTTSLTTVNDKLIITGNVTASGAVSASGAISTTSTIRGIMPQVISANMGSIGLSTTTDTYIPLAEGELEATNQDHVRVNLIAPFSGSLRRIVVRSNAAFGTNQAYTASLYVIHDDETASSKTLAGHHQIGLDADKHSAHALVFDFANQVTGSNVINGGDRVLISLKSSRNNSQNYYCTTVFAWDYHETTGIVTNSDGVIAGIGGI